MKKIKASDVVKAKEVLRAAGYVPDYWHIEDIREREKWLEDKKPCLTESELYEIAQNVADNADANYGICWSTFDAEIEALKAARVFDVKGIGYKK